MFKFIFSVVLFVFAGFVNAATITQTVSSFQFYDTGFIGGDTVDAPTSFTNEFNQFDSSLGTLEQVEWQFIWAPANFPNGANEILSRSTVGEQLVNRNFKVLANYTTPTGVNEVIHQETNMNVNLFSVTFLENWGGLSGQDIILDDTALAAYVGLGIVLGSMDSDVQINYGPAMPSPIPFDASALETRIRGSGDRTMNLIYHFTPIPEPSSLAMIGLSIGLLISRKDFRSCRTRRISKQL